jgi:hypothetical protein
MFFSKKINIGDQILKERDQLDSLEARSMLNFYWLNTESLSQKELLLFGYIREFEKKYQHCCVPNELQRTIYSFAFLKSTTPENQLEIENVFEMGQSTLMPSKII